METFQKKFVAVVIAALFAWLARDATAAVAPSRFVVLIDASPRMDAKRQALMRTVGDLARTGFHGRIQNGDNFSVRTSVSGTPLLEERWRTYQANELAGRAMAIVGALPYRSAANDGPLALDALPKSGDDVTLFVLTDGFRDVRGSGFDSAIAATLASSRDYFFIEAKPLLLTLVGQGNQWVAWGAHTNLGASVVLPTAPERKAPVVVAKAPIPEPPPIKKDEPEVKEVVEAAKTEPPKTEAPKTEAPKVPEPSVAALAVVAPTNSPVAPPTAPVEQPVASAPVAQQATPKPVEDVAPPEPVRARPRLMTPAEVAAALPQPEPEPVEGEPIAETNVPAPDAASTIQTPPVAIAVTALPAPARFPWGILTTVLAIVAAIGFAVYRQLVRPNHSGGSLISRSIRESGSPRLKSVSERKRD